MLLHGHHVRNDLGGVVQVGQAVVHGHPGVFGQGLHVGLVVAPVLDAVKEAAQHLGGVLHGLLFSHLGGAGVQVGHPAPLLGHGHFKGAAGAGGGLFKEQHDVLAFEGLPVEPHLPLGFQGMAQVQQVADFLGREVHEGEEGFAF